MDMKHYIGEVINRRSLSFADARDAMAIIMRGEATPAQIGSYLTALRMKGETVEEVAGSAAAMRAFYIPVTIAERNRPILDVVGTGGDGRHTFNISTTAAFIVAGHGLTVAKHGNRAASSRSGSADVLLALGANLELNAEQIAACIAEVGIGFMYAVKHHPAMRFAIGPRRELAQRTIFNILGPLTNPANASHYLLGVFDANLTESLARALGDLGAEAALVVHGADGLDELSTSGINQVTRLHDGRVDTIMLDPGELDLVPATLEDFTGGEPAENALITRGILSGADRGPRRDIVLLNAAAALSTVTQDFAVGLAQARESIDSGAALEKLEKWVAMTQRF